MCKYENDVYSIIIALSENNKIPIKDIGSIKFQAILCEMKKFNGDEYLNNIKNKFNIFVQEFSGFCKLEMNCTLKALLYYFSVLLIFFGLNDGVGLLLVNCSWLKSLYMGVL